MTLGKRLRIGGQGGRISTLSPHRAAVRLQAALRRLLSIIKIWRLDRFNYRTGLLNPRVIEVTSRRQGYWPHRYIDWPWDNLNYIAENDLHFSFESLGISTNYHEI